MSKSEAAANSQSLTKELVVQNKMGIHARPAAMVVRITNKFKADVMVEKDDEQVNGKSIMGLMMLAAAMGTSISVEASGPEAEAAMAALALVNMAFLQAGDEVLIPDNAYGPSLSFAEVELAKWGITHQRYDPLEPASLARSISPATRLVWLEAAGAVTLEFPDVPALVAEVQAANKEMISV